METILFTDEQIAAAKRYASMTPPAEIDPRIEALIGRVADKWTLLVLEVPADRVTPQGRRPGLCPGPAKGQSSLGTLIVWCVAKPELSTSANASSLQRLYSSRGF